MKHIFLIKLYLSDEKQGLYFTKIQLSSERADRIGLSEYFNLSLFCTLEISFVSTFLHKKDSLHESVWKTGKVWDHAI